MMWTSHKGGGPSFPDGLVEDDAGDGPAYPRVTERPPVGADDGVHEGAPVVLLHRHLPRLLEDVHEQGAPANR